MMFYGTQQSSSSRKNTGLKNRADDICPAAGAVQQKWCSAELSLDGLLTNNVLSKAVALDARVKDS